MNMLRARDFMSSLRQPLSKPLLLAVAVMLGLSLFIMTNTLREWSDVQRVVTRSELAATIGSLVHQLQIERGLSAFHIGAADDPPLSELKAQRKMTDDVINQFDHNFLNIKNAKDNVINPTIAVIDDGVEGLSRTRQSVTARQILGSESFSYYTGLIDRLLKLQKDLSQHTLQKVLQDRIKTLRELALLKERTGQIRAIGSEGFASGRLTLDNYQLLLQLIGVQNDRLKYLFSGITPTLRKRFNAVYEQPEFAALSTLQNLLLDEGQAGNLGSTNAEPWFKAMTLHIDQYKKIEDELSKALLQSSITVQDQMAYKLVGLIVLLISVLGLTLTGLWRGQNKTTRERNALQRSLLVEQGRSQQILESMSDAVCLVGRDGKIEYANPAMISAFGKDIFQQMAHDILPCVGSSGCFLTPTGVKNGKHNKCEEALSPITGRGYDIHCAPFHNLDSLGSRLVVLTDVTTHILTGQRLLEAKNAAVSANRTKSEILTNMSHELRTPLNAIIGFSDAMLHEVFGALENARYSECAQDIHSSGIHLLNLINDILDVSAIEAGKVELQNEEIDINQIIESSLRLIKHRADKGQIFLSAELYDNLPLLYGDERRLKQVMLNLLSNAVKFTPKKGTVTISTKTGENSTVLIVVEDTGAGMTKAEIEKAMEPFGQADSGLNRKQEGTGLGLPLTLGLIELHDGTMDIVSHKGKGTTIALTFPPERSISRLKIVENVAESSGPSEIGTPEDPAPTTSTSPEMPAPG